METYASSSTSYLFCLYSPRFFFEGLVNVVNLVSSRMKLLSLKVGLPDTVIIMMGLTCNSLDVFIETLVNQVWVLFVCWGVLQMFWDCMFIITLSAISKLVEPTEVGKFLCLVELANKLIGVGARPAYNLIYQATLKTYPATALYVAIAFFQIALALTIYTHFDIKKKERIDQKWSQNTRGKRNFADMCSNFCERRQTYSLFFLS